MPGPVKVIIMDCPLLTDIDAIGPGMSGFYYQLAFVGTKWRGAGMQRSIDGVSFTGIGYGNAHATWGVATKALGSHDSFGAWDTRNALEVKVLHGGPLAGASDHAVLNGANLGALIKKSGEVELLHWARAEAVDKGRTRLSRLLRGVRGTDWTAGGHRMGETFLWLDGSQKHSLWPVSEIQLRRWYKAVSGAGGRNSNSGMVIYAMQGNDLRPYAPVHVRGTRDADGNLVIAWMRQTRIGGENDWLDGVAEVPLSEESEAYEVDILNPHGKPMRTIKGLTAPTATYTRDMQVADWERTRREYAVVVYQMSATVGRGFGRRAHIGDSANLIQEKWRPHEHQGTQPSAPVADAEQQGGHRKRDR